MIISRKVCKVIEWHLERYYDLKTFVEHTRDDIINSNSMVYNEGGRGSSHSDTTAIKAIKLCNETQEERWIKVIEKVLNRLANEEANLKDFIIKKYFEQKNMQEILDELAIERTTFYRYRNEVIMAVAIFAVQERLIEI